jgi:hypothetical protein
MYLSPRRTMVALAFCWAWLGCVRSSVAQEAGVGGAGAERYELRWHREGGAESCVSGAALARHLAQMVGPAAADKPAPVVLDGRVAMAPPPLQYRVTIYVRDAASGELVGERELTSAEPKCSALTPAVLLVLAMSIDPDAAQNGLPESVADELRRDREEDVDVWPSNGSRPAHEPARSSSAGAAPAARNDGASRVVAPITARDRGPTKPAPKTRPDLRVGLAFSAEVQPSPSPGVLLGTRLPWSPDWAVSVAALAWLPRAVKVRPSPYVLDDAVDFNAAQLAVAVCRRVVAFGAARLDACAGLTGGVRWLSARALANQGNPYRGYWGPELGVGFAYELGEKWTLDAGVNGTFSMRQDSFTYTDHADREHLLFEPGAFSGRSLLSIGRSL